jgi:hypothetical protein
MQKLKEVTYVSKTHSKHCVSLVPSTNLSSSRGRLVAAQQTFGELICCEVEIFWALAKMQRRKLSWAFLLREETKIRTAHNVI